MNIEGWDGRYGSEEAGERTATPLLVEFASPLKPGRAVDLACGTGRNALWLARRGWDVTAMDGSVNAIAQLRAAASEESVAVHTEVADLEDASFTLPSEHFDLAAILFYLQRDLFQKAKNSVKHGGMLIAIAHTIEHGGEDGEQATAHRLERGELQAYFEDWRTVHYREGRPNDDEHRRAVAEIVAIRP